LYLQSNCIERIENLESLSCLRYLNLSNNSISCIENLDSLHKLETLKLAANKIIDVNGLEGLAMRQTLQDVDVSYNYIEDGDNLINFWGRALPKVACLYLHHNPCSRTLKDYRRRVISSLSCLRWLDERPVFDYERIGAEAWAVGGKEAEKAARIAHWQREKDEKTESFHRFRHVQQVTAERARAQKEAQAEREQDRKQAAFKLQETGTLATGWLQVPARQPTQPVMAKEPVRQAELQAKVHAFMSSCPGSAEGEAEYTSNAEQDTSLSKDLFESDIDSRSISGLGSDQAELQYNAEGEPPAALATEAYSPLPRRADCSPDATPKTSTLQWTNFRDERLQVLVKECDGDCHTVAPLFNTEFACNVSAEQCRKRHQELLAQCVEDRQVDSTISKDPANVREVSAWWLRKHSLHNDANAKSDDKASKSEYEVDVKMPSASANADQPILLDNKQGAGKVLSCSSQCRVKPNMSLSDVSLDLYELD